MELLERNGGQQTSFFLSRSRLNKAEREK